MIKRIISALLAVAVAAGALHGAPGPKGKAFLKALQQRDSVLIADQLSYGVHLEGVKEGTALELPEFEKEVTAGVELVKPWTLDTLKSKNGVHNIDASLILTSFEEGEYELPDLKIVRSLPGEEADTLFFEGEHLKVTTMPVDTATFVLHDLRGQIRYPLTFKEILPYLLILLGIAALALGIIFLVRMIRRKQGHVITPSDPPHIVALRKLDRLRGEKFWAPEKQKAFYSGITDALREYMSARYDIGAMEMTTAEIFKALKSTEFPAEFKDDLKELFETSDFVKFAKMTVDDNYNAKALPLAVRFVTSTYQAEVENDKSPSE